MTEKTGEKTAKNPSVLIVTGMSGAGKTSVLKALEDLGFEAVDNLPVALIPSLLQMTSAQKPLAVGVDTRTRDFNARKIYDILRQTAPAGGKILFLDCDDDKLLKRFTETRRSHPLAGHGKTVLEGIAEERLRLDVLRKNADIVLDTTRMRTGALKDCVAAKLMLSPVAAMNIAVCSFSFREGVPVDADLVFDVRFLRNPHYDADLRPLTGTDARVAAYIEKDDGLKTFWEKLTGLVGFLLPRYAAEGKSYLTIAVGCTGGKHRSVYVAEKLYAWILSQNRYTVLKEHRALNQNAAVKKD